MPRASRPPHRFTALALAAAMALALPGAALGVSSTASETLTVQAQVTLTGVPASLAYGSGLGGATLTAPTFTASVSTNNPSGATFAVVASDLTNGANQIAASNRAFKLSPTGAPIAYTGPAGTKQTLKTWAEPIDGQTAASGQMPVTASVAVPAGAIPGAYTGSVTFHADVNP